VSSHRYSGGVAMRPAGAIVIRVTEQGRYRIGANQYSLAQLGPIFQITARSPRTTLTVSADAATPYKHVASVVEAAHKAGVRSVRVTTVGVKPAPNVVVVNVDAGGKARIGGTLCTPDALQAQLAEAVKNGPVGVVILADPRVPYAPIAACLEACQAAGIQSVGFRSQPRPTSAHKYSGGVYKRAVAPKSKAKSAE
jgi:biopolymer transport protein ExbD